MKKRKGITHRCTDLANAEKLVELHGRDLRYVGAWGRWLVWDGARWALDDGGAVSRAAAATVRVLLEDATSTLADAVRRVGANPDDERAKAARRDAERVFAFACSSQNAKRIGAMVELARSFEGIAISHDSLDADPWIFNVSNGTIDLRTGELRPHNPDDLITKIAPVAFDPSAACPTWEAFLETSLPDPNLVAYLQRLVGYSLSGSIREHALVFNFGAGANGKSTFSRIVATILGDYGTTAPRGLLFRSKGDRHPTELAALHKVRFALCAEVDAGAAFDEALVKDLTGGDMIAARRMREDFWSFAPTHKLWLAGNHRPTVRGDDEGIWRRLRLIPWTTTIAPEKRDKGLTDRLLAELPGVLAWAVRGCLAWLRDGLGDPEAVLAATADYRRESDTLGQFIDEALVIETEGRITRKALRDAYTAWCEEGGYTHPAGPKRLAERLRAQGARETTMRDGSTVTRGWAGIRLATAGDLARRQLANGVGAVVAV